VTVSTGTVAATRGSRGRGREAGGPTRSGWLSGGRELGVLAGLYVAYSLTRVLASDDLAAAQDRARDIGRLEDALHLDVESWLNHATSSSDLDFSNDAATPSAVTTSTCPYSRTKLSSCNGDSSKTRHLKKSVKL